MAVSVGACSTSPEGKPVCPGCGCIICYSCRRPSGHPRWRCKACRSDFSITAGTLFAWHKLPLRTYLLAIVIFCYQVKGKSMLAFARVLDIQYKTAFVLAHKLREAMACSMRELRLGGEGRTDEIDGAYRGGPCRITVLSAVSMCRRMMVPEGSVSSSPPMGCEGLSSRGISWYRAR